MPVLSTLGAASLRAFGAFSPFSSGGNFIVATGGTITTSGDYKYHTFDTSDYFVITNAPAGKTIDFMLVGGGGSYISGTGGGGGVLTNYGTYQTPGTYFIDVATQSEEYSSGKPTVAFGKTALGGGAGGSFSTISVNDSAGKSGGSGGGGSGWINGSDVVMSPGGSGIQPTSSGGGYGNNGAYGHPKFVFNGLLFGAVGGYGGGAGGPAISASQSSSDASDFGSPGPGITISDFDSLIYGGGGGYQWESIDPNPYTYNSGYGGYSGSYSNKFGRPGRAIIRYLYK